MCRLYLRCVWYGLVSSKRHQILPFESCWRVKQLEKIFERNNLTFMNLIVVKLSGYCQCYKPMHEFGLLTLWFSSLHLPCGPTLV